jgi:iron complex transport system substrate-binding protein
MKRFAWSCLLIFLICSGCSNDPRGAAKQEGERVVSLAPSLTEIICAVGAGETLVGRTSACDYPPEILDTVPVVGGFGTPSLDELIKASPTLVLAVDFEDERIPEMIKKMGVRLERVKCDSLQVIPKAILSVGRLLDREQNAERLAGKIRDRVSELDSKAPKGPRVYVEIWGDPIMTAGRGSFVSDLVKLAGGRNIGDEVADKPYFSVSSEWVIARDPEVIICLYMSDASAMGSSMAARTGWSHISAVAGNRVYGGLNNSAVLRPGPRVLEGIEIIEKCLAEPDEPE